MSNLFKIARSAFHHLNTCFGSPAFCVFSWCAYKLLHKSTLRCVFSMQMFVGFVVVQDCLVQDLSDAGWRGPCLRMPAHACSCLCVTPAKAMAKSTPRRQSRQQATGCTLKVGSVLHTPPAGNLSDTAAFIHQRRLHAARFTLFISHGSLHLGHHAGLRPFVLRHHILHNPLPAAG